MRHLNRETVQVTLAAAAIARIAFDELLLLCRQIACYCDDT
ncbi:MAG: hypothetical protein WA984_13520 [Phormidesmis sp.]